MEIMTLAELLRSVFDMQRWAVQYVAEPGRCWLSCVCSAKEGIVQAEAAVEIVLKRACTPRREGQPIRLRTSPEPLRGLDLVSTTTHADSSKEASARGCSISSRLSRSNGRQSRLVISCGSLASRAFAEVPEGGACQFAQ